MFKWLAILAMCVSGLALMAPEAQAQKFLGRNAQGVLLQGKGGRLITVSESQFQQLRARQRVQRLAKQQQLAVQRQKAFQRQLAFERQLSRERALRRQLAIERQRNFAARSRLGVRRGLGLGRSALGLGLDFLTIRELERGNIGRAILLDRFFR